MTVAVVADVRVDVVVASGLIRSDYFLLNQFVNKIIQFKYVIFFGFIRNPSDFRQNFQDPDFCKSFEISSTKIKLSCNVRTPQPKQLSILEG